MQASIFVSETVNSKMTSEINNVTLKQLKWKSKTGGAVPNLESIDDLGECYCQLISVTQLFHFQILRNYNSR